MDKVRASYVGVDDNFKFKNGETGRKIFLILFDETHFLLVKTTSQDGKGRRSKVPLGCQCPQSSNYFVSTTCEVMQNCMTFDKDTWIQLDELFLKKKSDISEAQIKKSIKSIGYLMPKVLKKLITCASMSVDIREVEAEILLNAADNIKTD